MRMPPGLDRVKVVDRRKLFSTSINHITLDGDFAEFGTASGKSAKLILKAMPRRSTGSDRKLYLFDSWKGLPEDWHYAPNDVVAKGHFACEIPNLNDPRAVYVPGWFEDTVKKMAQTMSEPLAYVHIDCDLYSSTVTVLDGISHLIAPGTVIQFDEVHGFPNWAEGEWKAWCEFVAQTGLRYQCLYRASKWSASLIVL